jgi:CGNR zinc finger/Putative stress-induced transcription regulator
VHTDPEPLAVSFANTFSSSSRDRIGSLAEFHAWTRDWPVLQPLAARLSTDELADVLERRTATQAVLHAIADARKPPAAALVRATEPGLEQAPFRLRPATGGVTLGRVPAFDTLRHLLARSVADLLLGPQAVELRRCAGSDCRKVFVSARANRRWCDTRVCGNRARVAAHALRHAESAGQASAG